MAGNSSEMTAIQSKPQDSVSRALERDTAGPAVAAYGLDLDSSSRQRLEIGAASQDVCLNSLPMDSGVWCGGC